MSRVIIAGSRDITDQKLLDTTMADALKAWGAPGFRVTTVLSGGAQGVDKLGEEWAWRNNVPITKYMPNWEEFGPGAGPVRNRLMALDADRLVLLWDGRSKGSLNMLKMAQKYGLIIWERVVPDALD